MKVTDDVEHVHDDSKALSGLVDDVIKSANRTQEQLEQLTNSLLMMELMMVMIFSDILEIMDMPCIKVRKNAR